MNKTMLIVICILALVCLCVAAALPECSPRWTDVAGGGIQMDGGHRGDADDSNKSEEEEIDHSEKDYEGITDPDGIDLPIIPVPGADA